MTIVYDVEVLDERPPVRIVIRDRVREANKVTNAGWDQPGRPSREKRSS